MNEIEVTMDCEKCEAHIRADERAKVIDEVLALSQRYDMQDAGIHCDIVFKRDIERLKEQSK